MASITSTRRLPAQAEHHAPARMPFVQQVTMMTWRSLVTNFRVPGVILPPLIISAFFLLIYESTLGGASGFLPGLRGQSYLGFILPLSIVSAALSGAGVAGQSIVRDIENGYFDKLMLTPISRGALLLGPMVAGAVILVLQTTVVIMVALFMGLEPVTGLPGLLTVIGFALLLGTAFAGWTVGIALMSGNAAATQGASFLFFPLSFLTATFVPLDLLSGWIKVAATYNPITYILDAMRTTINIGWNAEIMAGGVAACLIMGLVLFAFAMHGLRVRTRRR
ncbi:MAG: ABC transporter permease [Chloroflexi bacterium]|nr:ABC transporter permease [Chloroflexota bacterium]